MQVIICCSSAINSGYAKPALTDLMSSFWCFDLLGLWFIPCSVFFYNAHDEQELGNKLRFLQIFIALLGFVFMVGHVERWVGGVIGAEKNHGKPGMQCRDWSLPEGTNRFGSYIYVAFGGLLFW